MSVAEETPKSRMGWARDKMIAPILVGVTVALTAPRLARVMEREQELSYSTEEPRKLLSSRDVAGAPIAIGGVVTDRVVANDVTVWNSGNKPLTKVAVRLTFEPMLDSTAFKILAVQHTTQPDKEVPVSEDTSESTRTSRRFVFDLLHPGNRDRITLMTNAAAELKVVSNAANLRRRDPEWVRGVASTAVAILAVVMGAASTLGGPVWRWLRLRRGRRER